MREALLYKAVAQEGIGKYNVKRIEPLEHSKTHSSDIFNMVCDCNSYFYTGRPCSHMFASILQLGNKKNGIKGKIRFFQINGQILTCII